MPRPRFSETEYNYWQLRKFYDEKVYRVLIFSDPHGWLADLTALRCINDILKNNRFSEVMIAGDLLDLPYVSRHEKKLFEEGVLNGYSEVREVRYTIDQILKPLRASTDAVIRFIPGNHDERITKPHLNSKSQLARLAVLFKEFETTELDKILQFEALGIEWDKKDVHEYFDMFTVVHGLSLAKNAPEKNVQEYMGSGASGHTHRLQNKYVTNRKSPYVWFETGCTRLRTEVEYFPTGRIPDWQNGFIDLTFFRKGDDVYFFGRCHVIIDGLCEFDNVIYNGNYDKGQR